MVPSLPADVRWGSVVTHSFGPGNWIQSLAMPISVMNARGELTFKSDGDARRLALGCKSRSQILVSLRVFGMERHYLAIQVSLSIVHKKIYKKCPDTDHTEISLTVTPVLLSSRGFT